MPLDQTHLASRLAMPALLQQRDHRAYHMVEALVEGANDFCRLLDDGENGPEPLPWRVEIE